MTQGVLQHRKLRLRSGLLPRPGVRRFAACIAWAVAVAGFALPACATVPHPKRHEEYKHEVEKLEEAWRIAQISGDVIGMDKLLSDDYVGITMSGQIVTKMQQLDRLRTRQLLITKILLDDVKVKLIGSTAIVTSLAQIEGTNDGTSIRGIYRYTRVYTRLASGMWKITNFEATRVGPMPPDGLPGHPPGPPPAE